MKDEHDNLRKRTAGIVYGQLVIEPEEAKTVRFIFLASSAIKMKIRAKK